jgi:hypothetical protein
MRFAWLLLLVVVAAEARTFWAQCSLEGDPIYAAIHDPITGTLRFANHTKEDSMVVSGVRRRLRRGTTTTTKEHPPLETQPRFPPVSKERQLLPVNESTTNVTYSFLRECQCLGLVEGYCPIDKSYCAVPHTFASNPTWACINVDTGRGFVRTVFLFILVWFGFLVLCLFGTTFGKNVGGCLLHVVTCGRWNDYTARRMLQYRPERAQAYLLSSVRLQRLALERRYQRRAAAAAAAQQAAVLTQRGIDADPVILDEETSPPPPKPTHLTLATRVHHGDDDDDDNPASCTICFGPLEKGQLVGDLPCSHVFHKECLKGWLSRRNVCPLCLHEQVAAPQFTSPTHE